MQWGKENPRCFFFFFIFPQFFLVLAPGATLPGSSRCLCRAVPELRPCPARSSHTAHGRAGTGRAQRLHSPSSRRPPGPAAPGRARPAASCAWSGEGRQRLARNPVLGSPSAAAASAATGACPAFPALRMRGPALRRWRGQRPLPGASARMSLKVIKGH